MSNYTIDGTENCILNRAAGAKFCSCGDTVSFNTCYLCGDAESNSQVDVTKYIPDSPDGTLTCGDMLEMPNVDNLETCDLLQEKYALWCGCPNASPNVACPFCPEGAPPNLEKEYPFANGGSSCSQLYDYYQVQTASACDDTRSSDFDFYLVDMLSYCECPGRDSPKLCEGSYCPAGQGIPTENLETEIGEGSGITCGDSSFLMDYITKLEDCDFLYTTADDCCGEVSEVADQVDVQNIDSGTVFEAEGPSNESSASQMVPTVTFIASILGWLV